MNIPETPTSDSITVDQALQQAINLHQAGNLQDAEKFYRAILEAVPNHQDANHNLGVLAVQVQQPSVALPHFKAALEADPNQGQYWLSYIDALIQAGQTDVARLVLDEGRQHGLQGKAVAALAGRLGPSPQEINTLAELFTEKRYTEAETISRRLAENFPEHGSGWKALGAALKLLGCTVESLEPMQKAAELLPEDAQAHSNLGNTLKELDRSEEAEASYHQALKIKPDFADAHYNLGNTLKDLGRFEEAEASYRRALEIKPDFADAHSNLGNTLKELDRLEEAEASYRRALQIKPDFAEAHNNLGNTLKDLGRMGEAEACYRQALEIKPDFAEAYNNLGHVLRDLGQLDNAMTSYRRALEIKPDFAEAHTNLLFNLNFITDHPLSNLLEEALRYGRMVAKKVGIRFSDWHCTIKPGRLRVGLVSGDLCNHPVGYFLESILAHIDQSRIELIAYHTDNEADELTARIKPFFSAWKSLVGQSDKTAARFIHSDGVHLLIDLSGHTDKNRLPIFAWRPAPIQATWLGYLATTGVAEIDYLLGDPFATPPENDGHFTETVWRLPEVWGCFTPPEETLEVNPLPALSNGYITFGCFNNLAKMNDTVVALWARVLQAVPGSRLFLKTKQLDANSVCETTRQRFESQGIEAGRLILEGASPRAKLLAAYNHVDIALDPFPYGGGTTSFETLWMAVPIITKKGDRFLTRCGQSLACNAGLSDWVAENDDDYVAKAVIQTQNLNQLTALRRGLRQQVMSSPLFDASRFARNLESAIWGMWEQYQNSQRILVGAAHRGVV